jgi:3-dehydroquinate synthase
MEDETRAILAGMGPLVLLDAPVDVLWERAGADPNRPLARDRELFAARHAVRRLVYHRFPLAYDSSLADPATLAVRIAEDLAAAPAEVDVRLAERSYRITVQPGSLSELPRVMPGEPGACLLVTDDGVPAWYLEVVVTALTLAGWRPHVEMVPAGEASKSFAMAQRLFDACVRAGLRRTSPIVALGGGVVGDLAGFVAATFNRGVPFVQVPTTLLAQIDSSVGGKVAINHAHGKNLIGAFHQPAAVLADTSTLLTLTDREYRAGLAEMIKYGVIMDPALFSEMERAIPALNARFLPLLGKLVARCCELKAEVVAEDERELPGGRRVILNFGHTVGHAVEAVAGYGAVLHGEAVALGMVAAARLSQARGWLAEADAERIMALLSHLRLPTEVPPLNEDELVEAMGRDKKNAGGAITFVLARAIGRVETTPVTPDEVRGFLRPPLR